MRGEHEIIMIPVTAIIGQGNTAISVHRNLPRPHRFIKNARDQRAGDLPTGITALAEPDCQQVYHVITGLRDRRDSPVTQHRADVRGERFDTPPWSIRCPRGG
jgi:hypothetical protein